MSDQTDSKLSWSKIRMILGLAVAALIVFLALQMPDATPTQGTDGTSSETQPAPATVPQPADTPAASPAASGAQFF